MESTSWIIPSTRKCLELPKLLLLFTLPATTSLEAFFLQLLGIYTSLMSEDQLLSRKSNLSEKGLIPCFLSSFIFFNFHQLFVLHVPLVYFW